MAERIELKDKQVIVMGMARSGCAAAKLLLKQGAAVTMTDNKPEKELGNIIREMEELGITVRTGDHYPDQLKNSDLIVISPGIPLAQPAIKEARAAGVTVISELELGYWFCRGQIAAITGTNGKTTTVHILHEMVKESKRPCVLAGNVGVPFCQVVESLPEQGLAILEVSSFQLETIAGFRPRVAAILNITPDHLNRYEGMQAYVEAKAAIMKNQKPKDVIVLNGEDKYTPLLSTQAQGRVLTFSTKRPPEIEGFWVQNGKILYRYFGLGQEVLMLADKILIPGPHNLENALAAATMALALEIDPGIIAGVLKKIKGIPHRLESIGKVAGVSFINDSKATNVDAVLKALESFNNPIVLILGGQDKQGDFKLLNPLIEQHARAVVIMGEAAPVIKKQLDISCPVRQAGNMQEAVHEAAALAEARDIVLLSPGCASYDQFENFEKRGEAFRDAVNQLQDSVKDEVKEK